MIARESVATGLPVDEDFANDLKGRLIVEDTDRHVIAAAVSEPVEQVRAARFAETALCSFRRSEDGDVLFTREDHALGGGRQQRAARPTPAHAAMAGVMVMLDALRLKRHRPAEALSFMGAHLLASSIF